MTIINNTNQLAGIIMFQSAYQACLTLKMHYSSNYWFKNSRVGEKRGKYVLYLQVAKQFERYNPSIHAKWRGYDVYVEY